jgi:antirestriction protein ArdC
VLAEATQIAAAERFFAALPGFDLRHGGAAAFYAPAADHVRMPPSADFRAAEGCYGTLAHEATHWTGHLSRLVRDLSGRFGSAAYAAEELAAELEAAFALAALGLAAEPQPDHARYVAHWLELLRADRRAVFTAASRAQAAADWPLAASSPSTAKAGAPPASTEVAYFVGSVVAENDHEGGRTWRRSSRSLRARAVWARPSYPWC